MSETAPATARLVLVCDHAPPPEHEGRPTEFGLQDAHQVLHPGELLADGSLRFELDAAVRARKDTGTPDFAGRFVHGPRAGRFLYLGWRQIGAPNWIRRYKIPLAGISWEQLAAGPLSARVSGAQRAATLSLLEGWSAQG
jgi:hypothetical protein